MMNSRLNGLFKMNWVLPILVLTLLATSCKNKKKAKDVSDTQQVSQEIEEEIEQIEEEDTPPPPEPPSKSERLSSYFQAVAKSSSVVEANNNIKEALTLFSSSEAVVLIEIYRENGQVDYDEPTTISKYLNYLKDTKSKPAGIQDMVYDTNGRIKELVLRKTL